MPKIYAKHNLILCGFISAKKPVGGSRGWIPQQKVSQVLGEQLLRERAALRGVYAGTAPGPRRGAPHVFQPGPPWSIVLCTRGSVLPPIILTRGTHGSETRRGLSGMAGGGSNPDCITLTAKPSLAGWALLLRELWLSCSPAPLGPLHTALGALGRTG